MPLTKSFSTDDAMGHQAPSGHSALPSFTGVPSFLRRPYTKNLTDVDVAITGIAFDCATTNRPGA